MAGPISACASQSCRPELAGSKGYGLHSSLVTGNPNADTRLINIWSGSGQAERYLGVRVMNQAKTMICPPCYFDRYYTKRLVHHELTPSVLNDIQLKYILNSRLQCSGNGTPLFSKDTRNLLQNEATLADFGNTPDPGKALLFYLAVQKLSLSGTEALNQTEVNLLMVLAKIKNQNFATEKTISTLLNDANPDHNFLWKLEKLERHHLVESFSDSQNLKGYRLSSNLHNG